jgi:4-amino-4-deoxy-L-arabinose transferase-like glycosyltransferase
VAHTLLVAPWPPGLFNDEAYYNTLGQLIANGEGFIRPAEFFAHGLRVPTAERAPLYPLTLAGLGEVGIRNGDARLLGTVTGGLTIVVLGLLGRRLAGERAGLLAAGLAALYPTLVAADGALMTESLFGLFAAATLLCAYRLADVPSAGRAVVLGLVAGLGALARAETLMLLALALLPLLRRPGGLRAVALTCLALAVVLAPWTIRNYSVFDRPVLIATEGGETLAGANCPSMYYGSRIGTWSVLCAQFSGRGNEAVELNRRGREGVEYALDNAGRLPLVGLVRVARTWGFYGPFETPEGREPWVQSLGAALFWPLLAAAIYGLVILRRRGVGIWIIATPLVTVTLSSVLAYGNVRFRHSAELSVVVLAAVAADQLWRVLERRRPESPSI